MSFKIESDLKWIGKIAMKDFDKANTLALTESAILLEGKAVEAVHVDTGKLRQSITRVIGTINAFVGTALEYAPFEEFGNNQLRIITFNYDRSLDHYLYTCLKNKYPDKKDDEYSKLICPIVHIHGKLGPLTWQEPFTFMWEDDSTPSLYVPYDLMNKTEIKEMEFFNLAEKKKYAFEVAIKNITVIHESDEETPELITAREWLSDSERIIFLGFGFHQTNLSRLKINTLTPRQKEISGTIWGLSRERKQHINQLVNKVGKNPLQHSLYGNDVYTFLHDKIALT